MKTNNKSDDIVIRERMKRIVNILKIKKEEGKKEITASHLDRIILETDPFLPKVLKSILPYSNLAIISAMEEITFKATMKLLKQELIDYRIGYSGKWYKPLCFYYFITDKGSTISLI